MAEVQITQRDVGEISLDGELTPLFERIYRARGIRSASELELSLENLLPPAELSHVQVAAARIQQAVVNQQRILVVGDFDADGATSVALALSLLGAMGADHVDFLVPNRFEFGYGLSPEIVQLAADLSPAVLITVDNGVSSIDGVAAANKLGIDVIVTDHHLPGAALPDAYAIVNPNLPDCRFASKSMAGVGVIFYLLTVVRTGLREQGWFDDRRMPNLADWLDLVALGTVADVVALDQNNRILVHQGLQRIRAGRCRPGIQALCQVAKRDIRKLTAQDLGFSLGPRLNAAGRLNDMAIGIRCLLADDHKTAREIAAALDELNRVRREIEQEMVSEAELIVGAQKVETDDRFGVCVYEPGWHQGVVGIVAGRLREKIHRPVIAFAETGDLAPDELKGSARSLPGLHVRDVLDAIAVRSPGLLVRFGGHAMAAGMSIKRVHYQRFCKAFDDEVRRVMTREALEQVIYTDGSLQEEDLSLEMAQRLESGGPWGQGFPEPVFRDEFSLVTQRVVGEHHLKLVLKRGDRLIDAIAFRHPPLGEADRLDVVYRLNENDYRNQTTLQLVVEHLSVLS